MKKIVVFSSKGGGGHTAVAKALQEYLDSTYQIEVANIFTDVLAPLDWLQSVTFGKASSEVVYNFCIARKWYSFLNRYSMAGSWYFQLLRAQTERLINAYLDEQKPDLIISVIPLVNNIILDIAQKRNIPFLLIPTDLDISIFIKNIQNPDYLNFKIALAFEDETTQKKLTQAKIPEHAGVTTGFVLRADFFEHKEKKQIKSFYAIPPDKPVILLLLGAEGSQAICAFAQQLTLITCPVHILVCIGKQQHLKACVEAISFPSHISFSVIEFTDHISDLMAITDLFISKSGSVSVNEAVYMNVPMILDATSDVLKWEKYNHEFITENKFGSSIAEFEKLPGLITQLLTNRVELDAYKQNLTLFDKKHGGHQIKKMIENILNS